MVDVGRNAVDLTGKIVYGPGGGRVHLTPTEWGLLEILVRHPGTLISRQRLLAEVWGPNHLEALFPGSPEVIRGLGSGCSAWVAVGI
ncbi:winged helix-turn-helix domain-containing protein [Spirillospora sp. CA-108201]